MWVLDVQAAHRGAIQQRNKNYKEVIAQLVSRLPSPMKAFATREGHTGCALGESMKTKETFDAYGSIDMFWGRTHQWPFCEMCCGISQL